MSPNLRHAAAVTLTRVITGSDGDSRFDDVVVPYVGLGAPLMMSNVMSATAISFRWTSGDYAFDFHPAPRRRLIAVLEGELEIMVSDGETRRFGLGDLLEVADVTGKGHISQAVDGKPFRSAFINLDDDLVHDRMTSIAAPTGMGVPYQRTFDGPVGHTATERGALRYVGQGPSGLVTAEIPLIGFQYVLAPGDLDYDWHPAPQRQFVVPLTGGMHIENGGGENFFVRPGEIYIGEDTDGKGHITRAIEGQERFSIFAHIASDAPAISGM